MPMIPVECGCTYKQFGGDPLALSVKAGCAVGRTLTLNPRGMAEHLGLVPPEPVTAPESPVTRRQPRSWRPS